MMSLAAGIGSIDGPTHLKTVQENIELRAEIEALRQQVVEKERDIMNLKKDRTGLENLARENNSLIIDLQKRCFIKYDRGIK